MQTYIEVYGKPNRNRYCIMVGGEVLHNHLKASDAFMLATNYRKLGMSLSVEKAKDNV